MESKFAQEVYETTKLIPKGKVSTYKLIAKSLGKPGASQAVGRILGANKHSDVPCHRVVSVSGKISGYFGSTSDASIKKRVKILENEGVGVNDGKIIGFDEILFEPTSFHES